MPRPQQNCFFLGAFHFHAGGFHARIILQGLMDNAPIKCRHRLQFHHVAPAAWIGRDPAAMEAVGLEYALPAAHYLLGVSLLGAGGVERGNQALQTFAKLAPNRGKGLSL